VWYWFVAESSFDLEKALMEFGAFGSGWSGILRRDV
jgi:hypothetical protein